MIVGRGQKSQKNYTATEKAKAFDDSIKAIVKEQKRIDELAADSKLLIKETMEYWIAEYHDPDEPKGAWEKEMKELFKIIIKEKLKEDHTTRLAFERELIMISEAKGGINE